MKECYQIKKTEELFSVLASFKWNLVRDGYQLKTNLGWVNELGNGQIVFIPGNLRSDGLLCESKACFDEFIRNDQFPVENPEQDLFDTEKERIKSFHVQTSYYQNHLNQSLGLDFVRVDKEAAQAYLKKVIGRTIKKLTTDADIVALISIIGQLVKEETAGKWFLEKRYGTYNPKYEPNIRTASGNVILMSSKVIGKIKWKVSDLNTIFTDIHSKITAPLTWDNYSRHNINLIELE